ncbi:unnamed protein product [Durusdinium trenchii]
MLHAGDAAHSILWVLASAQALGNLLVHSTVFLIASTALAWAAGLSLWPSIVFLVVQQSCQRCRSFRSYAHCFSFAEVMFWSQSSAFLAALTTQGFRDGYDSWRPTCAFWTVLATCGLIFMLFTACFDALAAHGFAPLLAAAATALLFLLWGLSEQLSDGAIWWFLGYLSQMENLWCLLFQWPLLLIAGVASIEMLSRRLQVESLMKKHIVRKSFHVLAICLFAPLLMSGQADFLALSQLVATLLFIALEVCRICKAPLYEQQNKFLSKYLDKREDISQDLVLTPLYLLLGCSLPVWLELSAASNIAVELRRWSGLLLIGLGDSCAALFGIRFGGIKWPGSHRTLVGTAAFLLSIACATWIFLPLEGMHWPFFLTTALAALLEVYTNTVDNLALPLFFCTFLKALEMRQPEV